MAPKIVNKECYYALKNRLHRFNLRYGPQLKFPGGEKDLWNEDLFEKLSETWDTICSDTAGSYDVHEIGKDVVISEENFERLLDASKELCGYMSHVAVYKQLGEPYEDKNGVTFYDYTYVAHEIFEICMFAMFTYTNFFQQCDYMQLHYHEPNMLKSRVSKIAAELYPGNASLDVMEMDSRTEMWMASPLNNPLLDIAKHLHTEDNYTVGFGDSNDRPPYREVKARRDAYRKRRVDAVEADIRRKNQEKEEKLILEEQRAQEDYLKRLAEQTYEEEDFSHYEQLKNAIRRAENEDPPSAINEHFYAYFEKLGIDEKDLNAQTLINEMHRIQTEMWDNELDHYEFCKAMKPMYRQLQVHAFEAQAKAAVESGRPIDFDKTAEMVDEVMAALYYTSNPTAFKRGEMETRVRATAILNGSYLSKERGMNKVVRREVMSYVRHYYKNEKGLDFFKAKGEEIYTSVAAEEKSTGSVLRTIGAVATEYDRYKADTAQNSPNTEFQQAMKKKVCMDNAYALEKRIETRYPSFWSKLFHFISYFRQTGLLDRMKNSLGIAEDATVRDAIVDFNVSSFVKETSNADEFNKTRPNYNESVESDVLGHIERSLASQLDKPLPEVDFYAVLNERNKLPPEVKKQYEEYVPQGAETVHDKYLREKKLREEQDRIRREREEEERRRREAEERESERIRRQEEEQKAQIEALVLEEKTRLYNEKVDEMDVRIDRLNETYNNLKKTRELKMEEKRKRIKKIPEEVSDLEAEKKSTIPQEIDRLTNQQIVLLKSLAEKRLELECNVIDEDDMKGAEDEARKTAHKAMKDQKLSHTKDINEQMERNEVLQKLTIGLENLQQLIDQQIERSQEIDQIIDDLWKEDKRLRKEIEAPSDEMNLIADELKTLKQERNFFRDNKDSIIESGVNLNFDRKLFLEGESVQPRLSALRSSVPVSLDNRYTIIADVSLSSIDSVEPPVDEGEEIERQKIVTK